MIFFGLIIIYYILLASSANITNKSMKKKSQPPALTDIPPDILLGIVNHVRLTELVHLSRVNKAFNRIINNSSYYKHALPMINKCKVSDIKQIMPQFEKRSMGIRLSSLQPDCIDSVLLFCRYFPHPIPNKLIYRSGMWSDPDILAHILKNEDLAECKVPAVHVDATSVSDSHLKILQIMIENPVGVTDLSLAVKGIHEVFPLTSDYEETFNLLIKLLETNQGLKRLILFTEFTETSARRLGNAISSNNHLEYFSLNPKRNSNDLPSYNYFQASMGEIVIGLPFIIDGIKQCATLTNVEFNDTFFGDDGAVHLANMLRDDTSITKLRLNNCFLGLNGWNRIVDALILNNALKELAVSGIMLSNDIRGRLEEAMTGNGGLFIHD